MKKNIENISIIVAIAKNRAIGINNQLLWHISADLKHFKEITSGKTVIMGKRTFESLPKGALPNRRNIVLSDIPGDSFPGCETAYSFEQAIEMVKNESEVFIIGGGSVYAQALPLASKLYITEVDKSFAADTFFPEISQEEWILCNETEYYTDEKSGLQFRFLEYCRKK